MTDIGYRDALRLVGDGVLVVFAAGSHDGEPAVAWMASVLPPRSARHAYSPDRRVRAAQAIGAAVRLGRQMRPHGFTPA